jgi:multicomponent Na+:H+ antiporter subunit G
MDIQNLLSMLFVIAGMVFIFAGSVGVVRLPDFYSRTHAISKSDTLGVMLMIVGLIVHEGLTLNSLKLGLIVFLVALANPIGSHALGHAAYIMGLKPRRKGEGG